MTISDVEPSLSPSMDIQVSSNVERLLFELLGNDGEALDKLMRRFRSEGHVSLPTELIPRLQESWHGESLTDPETIEVMRQVFEESGIVLDPHTAVGVGAARRRPNSMQRMVMATAHPAKFPDAVEQATGTRPALPSGLSDLFEREEHFTVLANSQEQVQEFVETHRHS